MKTVKTIAAAALALMFGGCVPPVKVSRTLDLTNNSSVLVDIPGIRLSDLSAGATGATADFTVRMEVLGCGYTRTFQAINKNHAYGLRTDMVPGRDFSVQLQYHGTDFGNSEAGWRVFVLKSDYVQSVRDAAAAGCNTLDMVVVYTVQATEYTTFRPETTDKSYEVVVNEHVL